jgi:hypothetical protein
MHATGSTGMAAPNTLDDVMAAWLSVRSHTPHASDILPVHWIDITYGVCLKAVLENTATCGPAMRHVQGRLEQVTSICTDKDHDNVVVGDSAGHIRVWDVSKGINTSSPDACRQSFRQAGAWAVYVLWIMQVQCTLRIC